MKQLSFPAPNAGGVLWQASEGKFLPFRSHIGHSYSPKILLIEKSESLRDGAMVGGSVAHRESDTGSSARESVEGGSHEGRAEIMREHADRDDAHARLLRESVIGAMPNPTSQAYHLSDLVQVTEGPSPEEQLGLET